jgi:hypothetical protein
MWQPIALLNILDKVIETITTIYLHELAEKYNLLLKVQIGARSGRFIETALNLLLSQIETV